MSTPELPHELLTRLAQALGAEEDLETILERAVRLILRKDQEQGDVPEKESVALAICTFVEAAKLDLSHDDFAGQLRDTAFPEKLQEPVVSTYKKHKTELRNGQLRIGWHPPHILGVDWKLQHHVKGNVHGVISKPTYLISFKTQRCDSAEMKDVTVGCTVEELQDMVWKLKEATRTVQQAANESLSQR